MKNSSLSSRKSSRNRNKLFKWLSPGLFIKRWLLLSASGFFMAVIGTAIWSKLTPIYRLLSWVSQFLEFLTRVVPSYISGPIVLIAGIFLIFWGQSRTVDSITDVLKVDKDKQLVDMLLDRRRLNRGTKIVVVGGGTGLSTLLRGLKDYSSNITAIVTVADDGGSSGRLRREIGVLPPGDIRNCLAALADEEELLTELFQYRFEAGTGLVGHSFGNLFLTVMSEITGDLEQAVMASSKVLAISGKVLPATLSDVNLWAEMEDGRLIEGESNIPQAKGKIKNIGCIPANPPALPAAVKAIKEAEYIIIGPGSLYTSIIPNLLVPEIRDAIAKADVPRIYVCNIMTQPGETEGYSVADHIREIDRIAQQKLFDAVLVHRKPPTSSSLKKYALENSHPVGLDRQEIAKLNRRIVMANVMEEDEVKGTVRHSSSQLARVLLRWYSGKWQPKI
ncbi:MAG: gluconeogenesis factor YvcK family protein [Cyanobacteria bacterium P01_G01_bin.19]